MRAEWDSPRRQLILALAISTIVSEAIFAFGIILNHSLEFDYLSWNLVLAWLPLLFAIRLSYVLRRKLWSSWEALSWSVLWLLFVPNSFYMISDFIHLQDIGPANAVFNALLLCSFVYTGVALGFCSLYLVHAQLLKRMSRLEAASWATLVLFICSVAIYFGRDLRWSSWAVFTNPGGLLFDMFNRIGHLASYPSMIWIILGFFVLLCTMYNLLWKCIKLFKSSQ